MNRAPSQARHGRELFEANCRFYDALWADSGLVEPERFNTWPLVCSLAARSRSRLEVAPGLRPRLPIEGTQFVDVSVPAVAKLRVRGADAVVGLATSLPFASGAFDLVCALDILEHVDDGDAALAELARVAAPGAALLLSVPLHPGRWTSFDDFVGHCRRYEPEPLLAELARHGIAVELSAVFGMQPESPALVEFGMRLLRRWRQPAMWWYCNLFLPLALRFQDELILAPGVIDTGKVDEILLVCRKGAAGTGTAR
jgi:SAM-dependent methyltransferase